MKEQHLAEEWKKKRHLKEGEAAARVEEESPRRRKASLKKEKKKSPFAIIYMAIHIMDLKVAAADRR